MNQTNRRGFFGWLAGAVASVSGLASSARASLRLEAVGIDYDGIIKPIDKLSYGPIKRISWIGGSTLVRHDIIGPGQFVKWDEERQIGLLPIPYFNGVPVECVWLSPSAGAMCVYVCDANGRPILDAEFPGRVKTAILFGRVTVEWVEAYDERIFPEISTLPRIFSRFYQSPADLARFLPVVKNA